MHAHVNALVPARSPGSSNSTTERKYFVVIGQANASGANTLHSVGTELANIGQLVDGHSISRRMEGEDACIRRVIEELGKNEWVHLACHGIPDRKQPLESTFKLHDGNFTIQHVIPCDLTNAEFTYLSASHTIVEDEESPGDESPPRVGDAICRVPFCHRDYVGGGRCRDEPGHVRVLLVTIDELGHLDHTRAASALRKTMRRVNIPLDQRILYTSRGLSAMLCAFGSYSLSPYLERLRFAADEVGIKRDIIGLLRFDPLAREQMKPHCH